MHALCIRHLGYVNEVYESWSKGELTPARDLQRGNLRGLRTKGGFVSTPHLCPLGSTDHSEYKCFEITKPKNDCYSTPRILYSNDYIIIMSKGRRRYFAYMYRFKQYGDSETTS